MSTTANPSNYNDKIDERTKYIVFGFIRDIEKNYLNSSCHIPYEISRICLSYISTHFCLNFGSYKWCISDPKIFRNMLSASNKQQFKSSSFNIGYLSWIIQAYPNGIDSDSIGLFDIFVKLLSLPSSWNNIVVCRTIECWESYSKYTCIATYEKDSSYGWCDGALSLNEVNLIYKKYGKLTFIISINILKIELIDNNQIFYQYFNNNLYNKKNGNLIKNYRIIWKINQILMNKMVKSNIGKCYESLICDNIFCIQCFPNGDNANSAGDVELYIQLCSLPKNINKLQIKYSLKCTKTNSRDERIKYFDFENDQSAKWTNNVLSFKKFKKYKNDPNGLIFEANINILNEYNNNNNIISKTDKKWDNYLKQIKYFNKIRNNSNLNLSIIMDNIQNDIKKQSEQIEQLMELIKSNGNYKDIDGGIRNNKNNKNNNKLYIWLKNIVCLDEYYTNLRDNGFDDLQSMKYVTMNELDLCGIHKIGHKLKLLHFIKKLDFK